MFRLIIEHQFTNILHDVLSVLLVVPYFFTYYGRNVRKERSMRIIHSLCLLYTSELEILKAIAAGGIIIQSAATFKIDDAEETTEGYACYQRAEKDGVKLVQMCEVNDQMMCYGGFNVGVGTNHNVCNHFYWRLVTDAPTQAVRRNINGEEVECLKIVLSRTDCADNSDVPLVGDQTAQVGNRTNTDRQSVIVNSAYKSIDVGLVAPYWAKYVGVNSYDLSKHRETYLAQNDNQIVGNLRARSSSGEIRPVPVLLGEWKSGKEYGLSLIHIFIIACCAVLEVVAVAVFCELFPLGSHLSR